MRIQHGLEEMQMDLQPFQLERALRTLTPSMGQLSPEVLGVGLKLASLRWVEVLGTF